MSFLWPHAWFFALLAVPIVVFYLIRHLPQRKPVSTLLFWDLLPSQKRASPLWRKLRRLLSLLLQLLFLLLLITLLARPLLPWQTRDPQSIVYVIDTRASMGAATADGRSIEIARRTLRDQIARLRASDQVLLVASGETPRILQRWTSNRHLLLEAVDTLTASDASQELAPALELAADLARQRDAGKVVVLTNGVIREPWASPPDLPVEVVAIPVPAEINHGLTHFSARRSRSDPEQILVHARLARSSPAENTEIPVDDLRLELRVNDRLADLIPIPSAEADAFAKTWSLDLPGAAAIRANLLAADPDPFSADNSAALSLDPVETIQIFLVSPPNAFLEAILTSLDQVSVRRIAPEDVASAPGDALFIFNQTLPPENFRPRAMLLLQPAGDGEWGRKIPGETEEKLISDWDEQNSLLHHVDLDQVLFPNFARYEPPATARIFADSFGEPVLFGEWSGDRRWLATAFSLDQSDLVYRTVFPIFIGNLVRSLHRSDSSASTRLPGEMETRLQPSPVLASTPETIDAPGPTRRQFSLPWHTWLLIAALLWTLAEWHLYHRRITE